jgi:hypothetical protein
MSEAMDRITLALQVSGLPSSGARTKHPYHVDFVQRNVAF